MGEPDRRRTFCSDLEILMSLRSKANLDMIEQFRTSTFQPNFYQADEELIFSAYSVRLFASYKFDDISLHSPRNNIVILRITINPIKVKSF